MKQLSQCQLNIFNFIKDTIDERGMAPTVREIANAVGLKSTSTVQYHLDILEQSGFIKRDPALKRSIRIGMQSKSPSYVPLIGTVTAGKPILAIESIEDYIPVPMKAKGKDLFALKIKGDSMVNAGILDGDVVIIDKTPVAQNGDIVVALIDDEATVKRFYKEKGYFRLQPENDNYKPIIVKSLSILGKVIMVMRSYN